MSVYHWRSVLWNVQRPWKVIVLQWRVMSSGRTTHPSSQKPPDLDTKYWPPRSSPASLCPHSSRPVCSWGSDGPPERSICVNIHRATPDSQINEVLLCEMDSCSQNITLYVPLSRNVRRLRHGKQINKEGLNVLSYWENSHHKSVKLTDPPRTASILEELLKITASPFNMCVRSSFLLVDRGQ